MSIPIVSFCMTAYNEEKYIRQAIESVLNQTEKNIELLLIDNASRDSTYAICMEYVNKDHRIRFQHNEKNTNLFPDYKPEWLSPNGEYFATIDADDYLDPDFSRILYSAAKENDADIVIGGSEIFGFDDPSISYKRVPPAIVTTDMKSLAGEFEQLYDSLRTFWGKLFKMEFYFANGLFAFDKPNWFRNAGDTFSVNRFLSKASSFVSVSQSLYHYRYHLNSYYSSNLNHDRLKESELIYNETRALFENWNVMDQTMQFLLYRIHFGSITDYITISENADKAPLRDRISFLQAITCDNLFSKYALININSDYTFSKIDKALEKILTNKNESQELVLLDCFILRIHIALKKKSDNGRAAWYISLLLSALCDSENTHFWGFDQLFSEDLLTKLSTIGLSTEDLKLILKSPHIVRHIINRDYEDAFAAAKQESVVSLQMIQTISKLQAIFTPRDNDSSYEEKAKLSEMIQSGDLEQALPRLLELTDNRPLDREGLYFTMYLCWQAGNKRLAVEAASAAATFWDDDPDIMSMCGDIMEAIGNQEKASIYHKQALLKNPD